MYPDVVIQRQELDKYNGLCSRWLFRLRGFAVTLTGLNTLGRTPLNEWWVRRRPTQRSLPDNAQHSQDKNINASAGFEITFPANDRLQTHALDRAVDRNTGLSKKMDGIWNRYNLKKYWTDLHVLHLKIFRNV